MLHSFFGTKLLMSQKFDQEGKRGVATLIQTKPCLVTQIKTQEKDGYTAVQIGFGKRKSLVKPLAGHLKKAGISLPVHHLSEVACDDGDEWRLGSQVTFDQVFKVGDKVKVTGVSKGKGFAGVVKRWGFAGGPKTHGQSDRHRAPGSIGSGTTPGRVVKGKKMAGHMGNRQVSVKGLTILEVDTNKHLVWVSGPVPGAKQGLVMMTKYVKC